MNPRTSADHPERPGASAALLAVAALMFLCAPARAGCGPSDHRPALPLGGVRVAPPDESPRPGHTPTCSGPSCSRNKAPLPIAPTVKLAPRLDLCESPSSGWGIATRPGRPIERRQDLIPIGRVTDIDRPPSELA